MTQIVYLIENVANGLYILLTLMLVFTMRSLMLARRDRANAEFALERELSQRRQAGAITRSLFLVEALLAVYAISNIVAPTVRADALGLGIGPVPPGAEVTVDFQTLEPARQTLVNSQGTPINRSDIDAPFQTLTAMPRDGGPGIIASPTLPPTPPGTIIPAGPVIGCERPAGASPQAYLEIPANGQVLYESVTVTGIANIPNFARYKFEISGPSTGDNFAPFGGDRTQPVREIGILGQLSLLPFEPGEYQFKLAVFDATDQLRASCTVNVFLRRFPPTPTQRTPPPPTAKP